VGLFFTLLVRFPFTTALESPEHALVFDGRGSDSYRGAIGRISLGSRERSTQVRHLSRSTDQCSSCVRLLTRHQPGARAIVASVVSRPSHRATVESWQAEHVDTRP
jgi:hypothetical protein